MNTIFLAVAVFLGQETPDNTNSKENQVRTGASQLLLDSMHQRRSSLTPEEALVEFANLTKELISEKADLEIRLTEAEGHVEVMKKVTVDELTSLTLKLQKAEAANANLPRVAALTFVIGAMLGAWIVYYCWHNSDCEHVSDKLNDPATQ